MTEFIEKAIVVWMVLVSAYALHGFVGTFLEMVKKERK